MKPALSLPDQREIVHTSIEKLKPYKRNARTHSKKQVHQIAESIQQFGFVNPVLVTRMGDIIAGHGRVEAARQIGMTSVPTLAVDHLSEAERRAYILADNKVALNAGWDKDLLALELQDLIDLDFEVELTGFSTAEIDVVLDEAREARVSGTNAFMDEVPVSTGPAVTESGDVWLLGNHRLICGDAQDPETFSLLLASEQIDLMFTDPPYNVKIDGNVCGLGSVRHREFAFASGEMSKSQFTHFLRVTLGNAASIMRDGAIAFVCMDWRHMSELIEAGRECFTELKNLVVWNKTNGGMGTFYRSKHELIFVLKKGQAEHTNNFGLGGGGRYRTNVWDYAGINAVGKGRSRELAMHPTVKPVALIADAITDCSRRGEIVLDCFAGSGSTLIAAEKTGRKGRAIECDPLYCDTIVRRWERYTGKRARHVASGQAFEEREAIVLGPAMVETNRGC